VGHACQQEGREKAPWWKGTNPKGKRNPASAPRVFGPNGLSEVAATCEARLVGCASSETRFQMEIEFQMNLEFGQTFRNFTRRFRRTLDMMIFPKFF
jgi:hypothetical protein